MIRILVPYDGSEPARAALAHARVISASTEASITLAYVLPRYDLLADLGAGPAAARDATTLLTAAAKTLKVPTDLQLLQGDPADAIAAEASRLQADYVILGARGRSPLSGIVLGSTARALLHAATQPLMVVHEPIDALRAIVAGVEQGESAKRVAVAASKLAAATGAKVTLVNVVDADQSLVARPERFGIPSKVWHDALDAHAERVFAPLRALAPGANEILRYGHASTELRQAMTVHKAQVLIVARKGQTGRDIESWFSIAFTLAVSGPFATLVV